MKNKIRGIALALALMSQITHAVSNISSEQMQMFQSLPPAQQKALAKQYGVDLTKLEGSSPVSVQEQINQSLPVKRGLTPFDNDQDTDFAYLKQMLEAAEEKKLKRFGVDTFATEPTAFSVPYNSPISQNYILGSGDALTVHLFGKENQTLELTVDRSGQINFPSIGPITIAGLPFKEARALISNTIQSKKIGVQTSVTLGEIRNIEVTVVGDSFKPGKYLVNAMSTITHALYASGGVSDTGSLRDIRLLRDGQLIAQFDAYQLLLKGGATSDVTLEDGDVIFIAPIKALVSVDGEVVRPAIYEVTPQTSVSDLIAMAGGYSGEADQGHLTIERRSSAQLFETLSFSKNDNLRKQRLKNGDVLSVGKIEKHDANYITVTGNAVRDGKQRWRKGLKVSDLFSSAENDVYDTADLDYSLILRRNSDGSYSTLQFSLRDIYGNPKHDRNYTLQKQDHIYVFTRVNVDRYKQDYLIEKSRKDVFSIKGAEQQQKHEQQKLGQAKQQNNVNQSNAELNNRNSTANSRFSTNSLDSNVTDSNSRIPEHIDYPLPDEPSTYGLFFYEGEWLTRSMLDEKEYQRIAKISNMTLVEVKKTLESTRSKLLPAILATLNDQAHSKLDVGIAEIFGEVKFPGYYPVTQDATIKSLILAAGGLMPNAYTKRSELVRVTTINQRAQTNLYPIDIEIELNSPINQMTKVQSRDKVNVLAVPNSNHQRMVSIQGEVMFPGSYVLNRGEKLSDLIARAGGLTEYAHADGSVFTREALRVKEKEQLDSYVQRIRQEVAQKSLRVGQESSVSSPVEQLQLIDELNKTDAMGRMVIDLPAIVEGNTKRDFLLEDGDLLYVPQFRSTITIMGEVQMPTSYLLDETKDYENYIDFAGGMKKQADEERIFIVRANGSVYKPDSGYWFKRDGQSLAPGDTIVVPVDSDYRDALSTWTSATQILYQIGVAVNAINK
jgi:protein involved in polysaccharide export with SLBB domain